MLILFSALGASSSDMPPDRKVIPGTAQGTVCCRTQAVARATCWAEPVSSGCSLSADCLSCFVRRPNRTIAFRVPPQVGLLLGWLGGGLVQKEKRHNHLKREKKEAAYDVESRLAEGGKIRLRQTTGSLHGERK